MTDYKKEFENAVRMIDWQSDIIKQQTERVKMLEEECESLRVQLNEILN